MADKFQPWIEYLTKRAETNVTIGFPQLELLLGDAMPAGAWERSWWLNVVATPQARAWLQAGWRVTALDFGAKQVTFARRAIWHAPRRNGVHMATAESLAEDALDAGEMLVVAVHAEAAAGSHTNPNGNGVTAIDSGQGEDTEEFVIPADADLRVRDAATGAAATGDRDEAVAADAIDSLPPAAPTEGDGAGPASAPAGSISAPAPDPVNRMVLLAARPVGWPRPSDFELVARPLPEPGDGELLIRNIYMSVDPYMRGRMNAGPSYSPPFEIGEPLGGGAVGQVFRSRHTDFRAGDFVTGSAGWREYHLSDGRGLTRVDAGAAPLSAWLGILGMPGLTAYVGLLDIGQTKPGETVFVSGAAGAVGSVAGQIAKVIGCRVVGSAGSDAKVDFLKAIGFDAAINYKTADLPAALAAACPDGIDVYFDNVGGDHLQAALGLMQPFGRIAACGMISQYNNAEPAPGPNNLTAIVRQRLTMKGFIVSDHLDRAPAFQADMARWLREGSITGRETVVQGIDHAVEAFIGMLGGENLGKMLVQLAPLDAEGAAVQPGE